MASNGIRLSSWCCLAFAVGVILFVASETTARTASREFDKAVTCLATNVYHEARGEPFEGQIEVARVVMNRVADNRWPDSVCGVVWQPYQFSWTEDNRSDATPDRLAYDRAHDAALYAMQHPKGNATHYHTTTVHPYWADALTRVDTIGNHIFYR